VEYVVLAAWLVQLGVGARLTLGWRRTGRRFSATAVAHIAISAAALALWIAFVATDEVAWGWTAFAAITAGLTAGDLLLVARTRRGSRGPFVRDYGRAVGAVVRRQVPGTVTFHALLSPVVWFGAIATCISA
jgi:hypothetical protein